MNKKVLRNLSYGVYAVSALGENRMSGCIANSIMQITSSPATLAVSMNHDNYTHECIEKSGMFAVSILSEKTDPNIISQLGFQSSRDVDKFMNVPFITKHNIAVVDDACGYLVCKVIDKMETNTHTVFLGEIIDCDMLNQETPHDLCLLSQYQRQESENAPTYQPEDLDTVDSASDSQSPPVIPPEMANGCVVSADMSMMVIFHLKNFQTHLSVQSVNRARINLSKGKG